jgi:hypothetical protein
MDRSRTVANWMAERNLDLPQLVEASRLDRKVVEAIVAGRYTTSPAQRQRIAETLGVAPEDVQWGRTVEVDHMYGHGPQFGRSP